MKRPDFEFDDASDRTGKVAGTPEGDGDFESDNLPGSGETSAGGQVEPKEDRHGHASKAEATEPSGLEKVIDTISHGTLLP